MNDGATFLFFDGERPRAVVSVRVRSRDKRLMSGECWRELVSLSREPLVCQRHGSTIWSPKCGTLVDETLPDAQPPAARPTQRLSQMRDLARRFRAASYKEEESPHELRLLTQPLYRYQDVSHDIVDGALFAFVEGNDVEAILLLEARSGDDGQQGGWQYTLARMTSYRVVAHLDQREVFAVGHYWKGPRKLDDPYVEADDGPFTLSDETGDPRGTQ